MPSRGSQFSTWQLPAASRYGAACAAPAPAERAILFGYEPPLPASPYREVGAVFAHAETCGGPASTQEYPPDWRGRPQVLRANDARGWIHELSTMHDGEDPEGAIAVMFANPEVTQIHSRNIAYGCYMFTVTRPAGNTPS
jgi:hypothetical protein